MINRVVEIQSEGHFLSLSRGFLLIHKDQQEIARIPLSDIAVLVLSGHGCTLSTNVIHALLEHEASIILCGNNYHPATVMWPYVSHHQQTQKIHDQIGCGLPLKKRLWQQLVQHKILFQGQVLQHFGLPDQGLVPLSKRVKSGDPENLEAQAARRYWGVLFGENFKRDAEAEGLNAHLNYGYAVLRGAVARSVAACGLNPSLGIFHTNKSNPFCLVDDLMEPFRPLVDWVVKNLSLTAKLEKLTPENKRRLAAVLHYDLEGKEQQNIVTHAVLRLCQSFCVSLVRTEILLDLPLKIIPSVVSRDGITTNNPVRISQRVDAGDV